MTSSTPTASDWNDYWRVSRRSEAIYAWIANIYRKFIICKSLKRSFARHVARGSVCLHAGSGSGEVDLVLLRDWKIYGLDFSREAVSRYQSSHDRVATVVQADNFFLPFKNNQFECVFNLGVMEHFTQTEIKAMLAEFKRVIRPGGVVILFWPPVYGLSVLSLKVVHWIVRLVNPRFKPLHPAEISLVRNRSSIRQLLLEAGFADIMFKFELRDLYTHEVIVSRNPVTN